MPDLAILLRDRRPLECVLEETLATIKRLPFNSLRRGELARRAVIIEDEIAARKAREALP